MIKCLPQEVQGRLRSGIALPSLQQCVEELIVNSIDAGATCVGVRMDMDAFKVQVIDNGQGMSAVDMGCVGNRYYTSKCNSLEDLRFYGFRGEALASIVSLATLVELSSRTKASVKTHVKIFRGGEGLDVFEAETTRPSAGTTVTVCNYFHNMPVRRKRLDAVLENERIRQRVEAISLMHPSVSFTLKNDCTGAMVVQLPKARNTYYRFVQIHSLARAQKLGEINYTNGQFEITGYIGKEGHYNSTIQFVYVNERLLLRTRIHKLLNGLLRRLSSSSQKNVSPDVHITTRSPKHKRSQDFYGVFVINIKCPYSEYDICLEPAKTLIEFKDWDGILRCIEDAVKDFLKREDLVAELSKDDMECESPQTDMNNSSQANMQPGKCVSTNPFPKVDSSIETALSSESVYRRHTDISGNRLLSKDNEDEQNVSKCHSNSMDASKQNSGTCERGNLNVQPDCEVEEGSEESSKVSAQQLEFKLPDPPKERTSCQREKGAKDTCLTSKQVVSNDTVTLPSCQQTFVNTRKVTLSDPFVHKSFQIKQKCKNTGFLPVELSCASKRKISLGAIQKTPWEEVFKEPVPVKIKKIVSPSSVSQSLDQFRRTYGKSEPILPINSYRHCSNFEGMNCEKSLQAFDVTNVTADGHGLLCPPTLTAFTKIKPIILNQEKSLAAKLCNLRQLNKKDLCITQVPPAETTSHTDKGITGGSIQENDNSCNMVLNPEPESALCPEEEQATPSDEWLPHYDSLVGKTVYVNKVTGLSSYEEPSAEQAEIHCTSDVTNIAVSVMSEAGMEYICYPFLIDIVQPFLPTSRTDRVCWSGLAGRGVSDENSNSLYSMYSKWNNPVYVRPPKVGVDISRGQADGLTVKVHNILFPYQFTKAMIPTMKVINQVDKKFLACLIDTREDEADHAYEDDSGISEEKKLSSSIISPPLEISIPQEEQRLLRSCRTHLQSLGLEATFSEGEDSRVFIGKVPLCFTEKDSNERRRGRSSVIKPLVEEYLREQIELLRSAGRLRATMPLTVQKVLASFACHGAIKFNDNLNKDECFSLVASLSACQLPFQCAHGRPSIAPLVDLHHIDKEEKGISRPNMAKLRRMYKAWQLFGNR
uniref:MutL homolog 3 (E. coli) n=1 Tax=Neogobius melanostomus TaxID=47308 RepID=A0A8C6WL67_9GOBI